MPVSVTAKHLNAAIPPPPGAAKRKIYDGYIAALTSSAGKVLLNGAGIGESWKRVGHFLAQAAHETGGFTIVRESLNYKTVKAIRKAWKSRAAKHTDAWITANLLGKPVALGDWAYGGRMGNKKGTSDGYDYRGGGVFQTTGRSAFRAKGKLAKVDLEGNPKLIEDPRISLLAAVAEWSELGCNKLADGDEIKKISRGINRGDKNSKTKANGEQDRIDWHQRISDALP